jgi:hypothetical protein
MAEKQVKIKPVLNSGEIDFAACLATRDGPGDRDAKFLEDQNNLLAEQRLSNIWDAFQNKKWISVLDAIKEIPEYVNLCLLAMEKFPGEPYVRTMGRLAVAMLFKDAQEKDTGAHFSLEQMKSVVQFLRITDEGLNREPWKAMFLKMAREYFPEHIEKIVEALCEAGIYEQEYLSAVWEHAIQVLEDDEALTKELVFENVGNGRFVELVTYIDKNMHNGSQIHGKRFLEIGDTLLAQKRVYDACQVYKALKKEQNLLIGGTREKIIGISDMYQEGNAFFHFSQERMVRKIKGIIKKSGLNIIIK